MATKETEADRTAIVNFIKGQSGEWLSSGGSPTEYEKIDRMRFAEKYASNKVRGWLADKELSLEDFVDSHNVDRVEFCELLAGKWVDEIEAAAG